MSPKPESRSSRPDKAETLGERRGPRPGPGHFSSQEAGPGLKKYGPFYWLNENGLGRPGPHASLF